MVQSHIVLITFPAQGCINPTLQLAKNLVRLGVKATLVMSLSVQLRMPKTSETPPAGLTFVAFSDGYDQGATISEQEHFRSEFKRHGIETLTELITTSAEQGCPVTGVVYAMNLPWPAEVARAFNIPAAVLWVQPATILAIYYHYFNGYGDGIQKITYDTSSSIELPGLPPLTSRDLPTFMLPSKDFSFGLPAFKLQIDTLDAEAHPKVLINTFDALEPEALREIQKHYNLVAVGPFVPSAYLDGKDPTDKAFGADLLQKSTDYVEWLDSKPKSSVVYIAFGSFFNSSSQQMEELARGLLESHRPFLWVIRPTDKQDEQLSRREELEKQGKIVPWCSQVEVLSHPSVGCFVTHCGWNSTLETLVSGIPVVCLPIFTDQPTNAKLLEDVFKIGLRGTANDEGIVEGGEFKRCIEFVMGNGEIGEEIRGNARKWKELAKEAAKEGGSSDMNLRAFVNEV